MYNHEAHSSLHQENEATGFWLQNHDGQRLRYKGLAVYSSLVVVVLMCLLLWGMVVQCCRHAVRLYSNVVLALQQQVLLFTHITGLHHCKLCTVLFCPFSRHTMYNKTNNTLSVNVDTVNFVVSYKTYNPAAASKCHEIVAKRHYTDMIWLLP